MLNTLLFPALYEELAFLCMVFQQELFLTAIWLSHGQLWAILEGTASLT